LDAQRLQVTQVAALLELDQVQMRATQAAMLVEIESADGIIVSGNQVSDCGGAGIQARGAMHTVIASNQVRRCGLGVQGVALQRSLVASNVIELTGGACVRLERSTDNHVSGNVTGMPSAVGPGSASHYELDRRSHRNTVMGNRTLFSTWQAASAVKVAAECAGNAIAFNDFRQLTVNGPLIDDAGASDVMWNLPEATLLAQVRAIVAAMMVGSDTVEVAYDEETGALALSVPAGVVDADAVDGLHGADLLAKGIYDPDDDGKVTAAVQADAVPWSGVTGKPAVYPPDMHVHALGDLSDVNVAEPEAGQALVWDSELEVWRPGNVAPAGGSSGAPYIWEDLRQQCNGQATVFALGEAYAPDSVRVFVNGLLQVAGRDYVESGEDQVTLTVAPQAGDDLQVAYLPEGFSGGSSGVHTHTTTGLAANRPAPGKTGNLFLPSNGVQIERDSGAVWSAWGPLFPFVAPQNGQFEWVNQGAATVDATFGGIYLSSPPFSVSQVRIRKMAAPAGPFLLTAAFIPFSWQADAAAFGLVLRQSSNGRIHMLRLRQTVSSAVASWSLRVSKWTDPATFSADYALYPLPMTMPVVWMRIQDDGTNRISSLSPDGRHWEAVHTVARTDFLTPDEVGFGVVCQPATGASMLLLHWEVVS
ncbi:MAG: right-handed parallel beta-helix repeat-containing protein, partial [Caldilinea sp.]